MYGPGRTPVDVGQKSCSGPLQYSEILLWHMSSKMVSGQRDKRTLLGALRLGRVGCDMASSQELSGNDAPASKFRSRHELPVTGAAGYAGYLVPTWLERLGRV